MQLPDAATQMVDRLDRQITAMVRMLDDLLDASGLALGKVSVQVERVAFWNFSKKSWMSSNHVRSRRGCI